MTNQIHAAYRESGHALVGFTIGAKVRYIVFNVEGHDVCTKVNWEQKEPIFPLGMTMTYVRGLVHVTMLRKLGRAFLKQDPIALFPILRR